MLLIPTLCGCAILVVATEFMVIGLAPYMSETLRLGPAGYGLFLTGFAASSAILGPMLVTWSRGFPLNVVLAGSMLPFGANIAVALWPTFELILSLRILQGAALPVLISIANVMFCDRMGNGRGTSTLYLGVTLGGTLTPPAVAALASEFGWEFSFGVVGVLALIGCGVLSILPLPPIPVQTLDWRRICRDARLWLHLAVTCFLFTAAFASFGHIAFFLEPVSSGTMSLSLLLLIFGIGGFIGNWLAGLCEAHPFRANALVLGVTTICAAVLAWSEDPADVVIVASSLIWGGGHAAAFVVAQVRLLQAFPEFKALAGSLNISAGNIGIAVGAYLGGKSIAMGGGPEAANTASAFLAVASILTALYLAKRTVRRPDANDPAKA